MCVSDRRLLMFYNVVNAHQLQYYYYEELYCDEFIRDLFLTSHSLWRRLQFRISVLMKIMQISFLIAHQDPSDVVPVDVEVGDVSDQTFSLVEDSTCRGKPQLVLSQNHIFNKKRTLKSGHIVWQCSIRNKSTYCSAVVKQLGDVV